MPKSKRGFASMPQEKRRAIASLGGKTVHALGKAHTFTHEEAIAAGKIVGQARMKRSLKVKYNSLLRYAK